MLSRRRLSTAVLLAAVGINFAPATPNAFGDQTAVWNGSTANWSTSADWSSAPNYPNNGSPAGTLYDVTISSGTVGLNVSPTIQSLNLSTNSTTTIVTVSGANTLTVNGLFTWKNSQIASSTVLANGGIAISGADSLSSATLTNAAGQTATIAPNSALSFFGSAAFNNDGTLTFNGGNIFDSTGDCAFNNNGTMNVNVSSGFPMIGSGLTITSAGTLNVQKGNFLIYQFQQCSITGGVTVSAGASLGFEQRDNDNRRHSDTVRRRFDDFTYGTFIINTPNCDFTGPGQLGGTETFNASEVFAGSITVSDSAIINLPSAGGLTCNGGLTLNSATISGAGTLTNALGQSASISSATLTLENSSSLVNAGTMTASIGMIAQGVGSTPTFSNTGTFVVNNPQASFQIAAGLKFTNTGTVNVQAGSLLISTSYSGTPGGKITVSSGASLLTTGNFNQPAGITNNGSASFSGTANVSGAIMGSGTLTVAAAATLQIIPGSGGSSQNHLVDLGTLDLTNNHLFINYGTGADPIASIAALLASGYAGGAWNGAGIISSNARNNLNYGIGYADYADPGNPAALMSGQIEIKYTLLGDANLDGVVNGSDFALMATNFNKADAAGHSGWDEGDFNYDGSVNGADFSLLAANFNKGASQSAIAAVDAFAALNGLQADVPEPASLSLVALAAAGLLVRRRGLRQR